MSEMPPAIRAGLTLILPRLRVEFSSLAQAASEVLRRADRGEPFRLRALRGFIDLINAWVGLSVISVTAHGVIIADQRADFGEATARLEAALVQTLRYALEFETEAREAEVLDGLRTIETEALAIMGMIVNHHTGYDPNKPGLPHLLIADHLHTEFGRILSSAMALRLALERLVTGPAEPREMTDAERARRYRSRRRRVALQVMIDVYDSDLTLLRAFGWLTGSEQQDQELVTKQIETLLLYAVLTYPHGRGPWRERATRQRGRLEALGERKKAQDLE